MKGKIVHIEIPADDTGRAMKFWGDLAGWQFQNYSEGQEGAPEYNMFEGEPGGGALSVARRREGHHGLLRDRRHRCRARAHRRARGQHRGQDAGAEHGLVRGCEGPGGQRVLRLAERRERTDAGRHGRTVRFLRTSRGRTAGALARGDRGSPPPRALGQSSPSGTTPRLKLATCSGVNGGRESSSRRWNAQNRCTM